MTVNYEYIVGFFFVTFYAYGRYNTPDSNRTSTTLGRFTVCWILYTAVLLITYWLFTLFAQIAPEIVIRLLAMANIGDAAGEASPWRTMLNSPISTALIFTTILPKVPVLNRIDRNILQYFWDLGEIPGHAVKLSHRLFRSSYHVHPALRSRIKKCAEECNIEVSDLLLFEDRTSPAFVWVKCCALVLQIERWEERGNPKYKRFLGKQLAEFEDIKAELATLGTRISYFGKRLASSNESQLRELRRNIYDNLIIDGRSTFKRCCKFIAHAVLSAEINTTARFRAIEMLGFEISIARSENLTPYQLLTLCLSLMLTFLAFSFIENMYKAGGAGVGKIFFVAFLMSVNFGVSAFTGIFPKTVFRFADIEITKSRSIHGYIFSGLLAVVISGIVIIALRFTDHSMHHFFEADYRYTASLRLAWIDFSWSYPYLLYSFTIGSVIAFAADNKVTARRRSMQVKDAAVMGALLVAASFFVYCALHGRIFFEGTKLPRYQEQNYESLPFFLGQGVVIGILIGFLVPDWYRRNKYRTPLQWVTRFIDRKSIGLKIEAGQLPPGELRSALVNGAVAIAMADGRIDAIERNVIKMCLSKLAEYEILDFSIDEAITEIKERTSQLSMCPTKELDDLDLTGIRALRGRAALSELLMNMCLAIGWADGVFEDTESRVVDMLATTLNLSKKQYPPDFGLSFEF